MFLLFYMILLCFLKGTNSNDCDKVKCLKNTYNEDVSSDEREAGLLEIPYIVNIRKVTTITPFCQGVLLIPKAVLTVCHCIRNFDSKGHYEDTEYKNLELLAGNVNASAGPEGTQIRNIESYEIHPECSMVGNIYINNFAILKPDQPFLKTNLMRTVDLHIIDWSVLGNTIVEHSKSDIPCLGTGFDRDEYSIYNGTSNSSTYVKIQNYTLLESEKCVDLIHDCCKTKGYDNIADYGLICAVKQRTKSTCFSDPGSPLICNTYVYGLLSGHTRCNADDDTLGPALYVRLDTGLDFFKSYIVSNSDKTIYSPSIFLMSSLLILTIHF